MMMWLKLELQNGKPLLIDVAKVSTVYEESNTTVIVVDGVNYSIKESVDKIWATISQTMELLQGSQVLHQSPVQGSA